MTVSAAVVEQHSQHRFPLPGVSKDPTYWFAIYTTARHEKRVAQYFEHRAIEHFLPLYPVQRKWRDGSRVTLQLPLFPCYEFVRIAPRARGQVLAVPGVVQIVTGTGGLPAGVPEAIINALHVGLEARNAEPHPCLAIGQRARICAGPFAGFEGGVIRSKKGYRVVLTVEHIMRNFSVEVSAEELEPIPAWQPA